MLPPRFLVLEWVLRVEFLHMRLFFVLRLWDFLERAICWCSVFSISLVGSIAYLLIINKKTNHISRFLDFFIFQKGFANYFFCFFVFCFFIFVKPFWKMKKSRNREIEKSRNREIEKLRNWEIKKQIKSRTNPPNPTKHILIIIRVH